MRTLHPLLSPGRRRWLERLELDGVATRSRGRTGYDCIRLGWTQWVLDFGNGPITEAEAEMIYGPRWGIWPPYTNVGETLTDAGRKALEHARRSEDAAVREVMRQEGRVIVGVEGESDD